jgi:hypothetical protein
MWFGKLNKFMSSQSIVNVCIVNECVKFVFHEQTTQLYRAPVVSFCWVVETVEKSILILSMYVTDRRLLAAQPSALKMDIVAEHVTPRDALSLQVVASICLVLLMHWFSICGTRVIYGSRQFHLRVSAARWYNPSSACFCFHLLWNYRVCLFLIAHRNRL